MIGKIIDGRVRQKAQTLEEWNNSTLDSLDGEQLFIRSDVDDAVIGFKFGAKNKTFSELPFIDLTVKDKANPGIVFSGKPSGIYVPTANGNYDGINVNLAQGYQVIYWDGSIAQKVVYPIDYTNLVFGGVIDDSKDLSNPTEPVWYIAKAGEYNTVPPTSLGVDSILTWNGSGWSYIPFELEVRGEFLIADNVQELRSIPEQVLQLLVNGTYKGVTLLGYYIKGDTPAPIEYYLSNTIEEDDGGSVIEIGGVKLEMFNKEVYLSNFGAKGDGVEANFTGTDDTVSFENAIKYVNKVNGILKSEKFKKYLLKDKTFALLNVTDESFKIDLNGAKLLFKNYGIQFAKNSNVTYKTINLSLNTYKGATYIEVDNVSDLNNVQKGDLMALRSPALTYSSVTIEQYYVINDIDVNSKKIYIEGTVVGDVTYEQITADGKTGNITASFYKLYKDMGLRNFEIISNKTVETCISIQNHDFLLIENVTVKNASRFGIYVNYGGRDKVVNFKSFRHGYVDYDQGYAHVPSSPSGSSFGYGIYHARNAISHVENSSGYYGWHTFDCGRGQTYIKYLNCNTYKDAIGFSSHDGAWHTEYISCDTIGGNGLTSRGHTLIVNGCNFAPSLLGHGISGIGCFFTSISNTIIDKASLSTGSAIYLPDYPSTGNGFKSIGVPPTLIIDNVKCINAKERLLLACDKIIVNNLRITSKNGEGSNVTIRAKELYIDNIKLDNISNQAMISVHLTPGLKARINDVSHTGSYIVPGGSAAIFFYGTVASEEADGLDIEISRVRTIAGLLRALDINSNLRIKTIRDCEYKSLGTSDSPVKIVNCYNNIGDRPEYMASVGATFDANGTRYNNTSPLAKKIGNTANRPANTEYLGLMNTYVNTQTGLTEIWDGSSWKAFTPNATTTVKGSVNQSTAIADIVAPAATDLPTGLTLLNELRTKFQAELNTDRASGQRAT